MKPIAFVNGEMLPLSEAKISIMDRGFTLGDGLFETMRAFKNKVFRLEDHLDRFFNSTEEIYINVPYSKDKLKEIISKLLELNELDESILRLTLTRGISSRGLSIDPAKPSTLVILVQPFEGPPLVWYDQGIKVTLHPSSATQVSGISTQIKSIDYLSSVLVKKRAEESNAQEGLLLDDKGRVCEGTSTNVFIVKNDSIMTPSISNFVLPGITRKIVMELAKNQNNFIEPGDIWVSDLENAEEIFLTNSVIGIIPVRQIEDRSVNSCPGPVTCLLSQGYSNLIDEFSRQ